MPKRSEPRLGRPRDLAVVRGDGSTRPPRRGSAARTRGPRFPLIVDFGRGNAIPRREGLVALHACAEWLAKRLVERVAVVGHANKRGSDRAALLLARARVAAVTSLLVLLGASPAQVVALPTARLHTVWAGSTPAERRRSRIVVVFRYSAPQGEYRSAGRPVAGRSSARQAPRERAVVSAQS